MFKDIAEMKRHMHIKSTDSLATCDSFEENWYKHVQINARVNA